MEIDLERVSLEGLNDWLAQRQADARTANQEAAACAYDLARGYRELKRRLTKPRQEARPEARG